MQEVNPLRDKLRDMDDAEAQKYTDRLREQHEDSEYYWLFLWACDEFEAATVRALQAQEGPDAATNATLGAGRLQAVELIKQLFLARSNYDGQEEADAGRNERPTDTE